jgi:hypothetical protein
MSRRFGSRTYVDIWVASWIATMGRRYRSETLERKGDPRSQPKLPATPSVRCVIPHFGALLVPVLALDSGTR